MLLLKHRLLLARQHLVVVYNVYNMRLANTHNLPHIIICGRLDGGLYDKFCDLIGWLIELQAATSITFNKADIDSRFEMPVERSSAHSQPVADIFIARGALAREHPDDPCPHSVAHDTHHWKVALIMAAAASLCTEPLLQGNRDIPDQRMSILRIRIIVDESSASQASDQSELPELPEILAGAGLLQPLGAILGNANIKTIL